MFRLPPINKSAASEPVTKPIVPDWERPTEWLPLPEVVEGDKKFVGLYYITKHTNRVTFYISGNSPIVSVDWGDGTVENNLTPDHTNGYHVTHVYNYDTIPDVLGAGKQVVVSITTDNAALTFKAVHDNLVERAAKNWLDIKMAGEQITNLDFAECEKLERFHFVGSNSIANLDFDFEKTYNLRSFIMDTSKVAHFYRTFYYSGLKVAPNFDFSSATKLRDMFRASKLILVNEFNAPLATDAEGVFYDCRDLEWIDKINLPSATTVYNLFRYTEVLKKINQEVFNLSNVTNASDMFHVSKGITELPELTFSDGVNIYNIFYATYALKSVNFTNPFTPSTVSGAFKYSALENYPLNLVLPLNTSYTGIFWSADIPGEVTIDCTGVTSLNNAFASSKFKKVTLVNAESCTDFTNAFAYSEVEEVIIDSTAAATNMKYMFRESKIKSLPTNLQTANVHDFSYFAYKTEIENVPFTDLSSATNCDMMFSGCSKLKSLPTFITSPSLTKARYMFGGTNMLSLEAFDTSNVTDFTYFFPDEVEEVGAFNFQSATGNPSFPPSLKVFDGFNMKISLRLEDTYFPESEIIKIFNNLSDLTTLSSQNITFASGTLNRLQQTTKDIALNKNWTITG